MKKTFRRFNVKGVYIFNYILFSLYLFVSLSAVFTQNVLSIWFYLFQFISPSRTSNFALIILQSLYPWPSILKPSSSRCYHLSLGILTLSLFLHKCTKDYLSSPPPFHAQPCTLLMLGTMHLLQLLSPRALNKWRQD